MDGGPERDSATQALGEAISNGDRSLDLVMLTHLDSDHSLGLLEILDRYEVGAVPVLPARRCLPHGRRRWCGTG